VDDGQVADGLSLLLEENFTKLTPPEAKADPDIFRRKRLYTPEAHAVLIK
jgi:hypothetical protein